MSLPAPSPLNSNFTLIRNTKISASLNIMSSLKKQCLIICTSRNHNEVQTQICTARLFSHPYQITFYFSSMLWCGCGVQTPSKQLLLLLTGWETYKLLGFYCAPFYRPVMWFTADVQGGFSSVTKRGWMYWFHHALIIGLNLQKDGNRFKFFHLLI